jgi:hypothetical protein
MAVLDLDGPLHCRSAGASQSAKYEPGGAITALDGEMKGLLVITLTLLTAATALAYGHAEMAAIVTDSSWPSEPTTLLLSGGALLGVGGALRRFSF